eukprot:m.119019 g.119019  ORF g.119019 m.119019 type:complete len:405 (-) comp9351_c0_seq2:2058-3272(-)
MGDIGFANLQNQIHRAAVERGFEFTLMVAGRSGLGKSTFVNSLFSSKIYSNIPYGVDSAVPPVEKISRSTVTLLENHVRLSLTLVDTPGFGDSIDNTGCWDHLVKYIVDAFETYDAENSKLHRGKVSDIRVHCCLYFIPPSTHGLRDLDIETLRHLQNVVNVIPVIAKADTLTEEECTLLKQRIRETLANENIHVFQFPAEEVDGDETLDNEIVANARDNWPFAVCASEKVVNIDGKVVRGRSYPWGDVSIEDPLQSDFLVLRDLLIRTHMQHLIDSTNDIHYETFRRSRLNAVGGDSEASDENVMEVLTKKKKSLLVRLEEQEREKLNGLHSKYQMKLGKVASQMESLEQKHATFKTEMHKHFIALQDHRTQFENEKREFEEDKQMHAEEKKHKRKFFGTSKK